MLGLCRCEIIGVEACTEGAFWETQLLRPSIVWCAPAKLVYEDDACHIWKVFTYYQLFLSQSDKNKWYWRLVNGKRDITETATHCSKFF